MLLGQLRLRPPFQMDLIATSLVERLRTDSAQDRRKSLELPHSHGSRKVPRFNVSGGYFLALVPARDAVAIHTGAIGEGSESKAVINYAVRATTAYGQVGLRRICDRVISNQRSCPSEHFHSR